MAIHDTKKTYSTFHIYPAAWMSAVKTIYELQRDLDNGSATTSDSRFEAYETTNAMINNKEVEYEMSGGNFVFASTVNYAGSCNYLEVFWFDHQYNFYIATQGKSSALTETEIAAEITKITAGTQNTEDKKEPVITDSSNKLAPNGKHYSIHDLQSTIEENNLTLDNAIVKLAGTEKYRNTTTVTTVTPSEGVTENNKDPINPSGNSGSGGVTFSSDIDRKKNEQLAKEHPERVVDGVYYADDAALKKAQEAKEARVKEETAQATAEAKANAEKLATTLSTIQKTLYGTDNSDAVDQLSGTVGGVDMNAALGDAASIRKRQKLLNFKTFVADYKEPSSGKPANNADPFPTDQKIEELEAHQPRVKIHEVTTHVHGQAATIAAMSVSDNAEKRIVRLENNMATIMRYLFRLGTRVSINCQYWGHF